VIAAVFGLVDNRSTMSNGTDAKPERLCDLIMKGGITSGIIYPAAVCELASTFHFKNICGTSAGAIAARRQRPPNADAGTEPGVVLPGSPPCRTGSASPAGW
jgi:hypothetical protein